MISTPWERRAAEHLNDLLESRTSAHGATRASADLTRATAPSADDDGLVLLTGRLEQLGASANAATSMDPDFRQRLRTRLVAVASVTPVAAEPAPVRRVSLPRRAALISATVAVLIGLSGVGFASNSAVPGDTLYTIKRSREAAQLALAGSDASRAQLHLQFAETRLDEAQSVRADAEALRKALDDMDADVRSAMRDLGGVAVERSSAAPLDAIDTFLAAQRPELEDLAADLSGGRQQRAVASLELFDQVAERSDGLRQSLECANGNVGSERSDELGPLPRRCAALPAMNPGGNQVEKPRTTPEGAPEASTAPNSAAATPSAETTPSPGVKPETSPSPNVLPSPSQNPNNGIVDSLGGILGGILGTLIG